MASIGKPTLIYDTREQKPYPFIRFSDQFSEIIRATLKTGDYSIDGFTDKVCVERKSLQDLVMTITHGRTRFQKELVRMSQMEYAAVVIEASLAEVAAGYSFSQANPSSILGSIQSFSLLYGVHFFFAGDRIAAESLTAGLLTKYYKYKHSQDL